MDDRVEEALRRSQLVDITTTGRRTGQPRRIEVYLHRIGDRLIISGIPSTRKRGWMWNLEADPRLTLHLKGRVTADLSARARAITEEAERRQVLADVARAWGRTDLEAMVRYSPLIELSVEGLRARQAA